MKIRISELRKIIKEELLKEALPPATSDFHQSALRDGFQKLVGMFPNVLQNQIVVQKLGGANFDNRQLQASTSQTKDYVTQASAAFQKDLAALLEKHFVQGVKNFQPTGQTSQPAPQVPAEGPNPDQKQTMMPPPMAAE